VAETGRDDRRASRRTSIRPRQAVRRPRSEAQLRQFAERLSKLDSALAEELSRPSQGPGRAATALGALVRRAARILQQLDALRTSERADEFGLDPEFEELVAPFFRFLYRVWWRVTTEGIENVPAQGPVLLVANHAGALFPWDAAMLKVALRLDHPSGRELRFLAADFPFRMPFLGSLLARVGAARACRENAMALLDRGEAVVVFPEGLRGIGKPFSERYRLQRFGRGGFVTVARRTAAPILPVAIVGSEEIHPLLARWEGPARRLGLPYLPVTPTFPWLGLLGLVPLPTKWTIRFGSPLDVGAGAPAPGDSAEPIWAERVAAEIRDLLQKMIDEILDRRRSVFF
jgi:1-acyl-sn-glycerol-3-phosphate acyltransferase